MIELILSLYNVTDDDLRGKSRKANVVEARQMCWYFLRKSAKKTFQSIAKTYNRTHPTVVVGIYHVQNLIEVDKKTQSFYQKVTEAQKGELTFAE